MASEEDLRLEVENLDLRRLPTPRWPTILVLARCVHQRQCLHNGTMLLGREPKARIPARRGSMVLAVAALSIALSWLEGVPAF
jgi:hypothetical protein